MVGEERWICTDCRATDRQLAPDRRMGTYVGPDGIARRVNGTIAGNRIDFYIDWNVPNQSVTALQGLHFTGYVYAGEHGVMAGSMLDNRNGNTWAFTAMKSSLPVGVPGAAAIGIGAYWGVWDLDTDGTHGTLTLTPGTIAGAIAGTFRSSSGAVSFVTGAVQVGPPSVRARHRRDDVYRLPEWSRAGARFGIGGRSRRDGGVQRRAHGRCSAAPVVQQTLPAAAPHLPVNPEPSVQRRAVAERAQGDVNGPDDRTRDRVLSMRPSQRQVLYPIQISAPVPASTGLRTTHPSLSAWAAPASSATRRQTGRHSGL